MLIKATLLIFQASSIHTFRSETCSF